MPGGVHHEWGKLREVVVGICPADELVVFHEESQRWLASDGAEFARKHAGRHCDVAYATFDEVPGKRSFGENRNVRPRFESVYL